MADAKTQTSLQKVATATRKAEDEREVRNPKRIAIVNGGDRSNMVEVRLTRRFQDLVQLHEVGTLLTIPKDLAPKSAKPVGEKKGEPAPAKEPEKAPAKSV